MPTCYVLLKQLKHAFKFLTSIRQMYIFKLSYIITRFARGLCVHLANMYCNMRAFPERESASVKIYITAVGSYNIVPRGLWSNTHLW